MKLLRKEFMLKFIGNFIMWVFFGPFWLVWMLIKALRPAHS